MNYLIIGYRKVNYTSKKTGKVVDGVELYLVTSDIDKSITVGQSCEKLFLSSLNFALSEDIVNKECRLIYNLFQGQPRLSGIEII